MLRPKGVKAFLITLIFINMSTIAVAQQVTELVVYRIKADADRTFILHTVDEELAKFPGFINRRVEVSTDDTQVLVDYVQWQSLEQAQAAAEQVMQNPSPKVATFLSMIEEIIYFKHFKDAATR